MNGNKCDKISNTKMTKATKSARKKEKKKKPRHSTISGCVKNGRNKRGQKKKTAEMFTVY